MLGQNIFFGGLVTLLGAQQALALGQKQCVMFQSWKPTSNSDSNQATFNVGSHFNSEHDLALEHDSFVIAAEKGQHPLSINEALHTPILTDSKDDEAIHLAAASYARDIYKIVGVKPKIYNDTLPNKERIAVIVGSVESKLISSLDLDYTDELKGKWESFDVRVVQSPGIKGIDEALIITGSDRRGTIFGLYDLCEQMGVSPWYWWDDVHIPKHPVISFNRSMVCSHGEPTVKYRGVFINDELPVMWNWAKDHFNISKPESPFQTGVYERMFETILRMKANFMWPAMWVSMFAVDGLNPQKNGLPKEPIPGPNQALAHRMGVVMGTSHHEPMSRNKPEWDLEGSGDWDWRNNEKKLTDWWTYGAERAKGLDTVFTMGMRGDGDAPLNGASIELLEEITDKQREMIRNVYGKEAEDVPQLWALYKEVMGYYLGGMKIPDEVTALFADDNWGNIMGTLPFDHNHTAGGGIYYHADYVGTPTQYKWINTINLAKTWEQMQILHAFRTTGIWIVNVGDVKHHELPAEHFLHLAYDFDAWPRNSVTHYLKLWAEREFGKEESGEIADIMAHYSQLTARIKPELYNATLYSYHNYEEAEKIEKTWDDLYERVEKVFHKLPKARRNAFFEVVYAPVTLVYHANRMYIAAGKNNVHAFQGRTSANRLAEKALREFNQDYNITQIFHTMLDGKWNHILSQPHLNMNPHFILHKLRDTLPPVSWVQENAPARPRWDGTWAGQEAYLRYTVENSLGAWPGHGYFNCPQHFDCPNPALYRMDPYGSQKRWVDVACGGPMDVKWTAEPSADWLIVNPRHGETAKDGTKDQRVYVSIDWDKVPNAAEGNHTHWDNATVHFSGSDGSNITLSTPISKPNPPPKGFKGHVEGDGYVVMETSHFTRNNSKEGYAFEEIEWYGRTLSGMEMYPTTDVNFTMGEGPSLEYDFWTTGSYPLSKQSVEVTIQLGPTFNFQLGKELSFALAFDGEMREIHPIPPVSTAYDAGSIPRDWENAVREEIRNSTQIFDLNGADQPGKHTISLYGMSSGLIIERIWLDLGGIKPRGYSLFGPPESYWIKP